jgi:hypothetical protein
MRRGWRHRATWHGLVLMLGTFAAHGAEETLHFKPPEFLEGPVVTRAATGVTFTFEGQPPYPAARLRITQVTLPPDVPAPDGRRCGEAFLQEIRRQSPDAIWREVDSLQIGALTLGTWRWAGDLGPQARTGLVSCTTTGPDQLLAVVLEDHLTSARDSFPAIRTALRGLSLGAPPDMP